MKITGAAAEVSLQALLDHTITRLLSAIENVLASANLTSELTMFFKWGCDGSSGHSAYKQRFQREPEASLDQTS